ncbi:unnamed protein product [Amoebophrya sp. A120]|nr:unnamed protein product [Amoebophrya sp. A120]|eukprot:GSA120T00007684001.1
MQNNNQAVLAPREGEFIVSDGQSVAVAEDVDEMKSASKLELEFLTYAQEQQQRTTSPGAGATGGKSESKEIDVKTASTAASSILLPRRGEDDVSRCYMLPAQELRRWNNFCLQPTGPTTTSSLLGPLISVRTSTPLLLWTVHSRKLQLAASAATDTPFPVHPLVTLRQTRAFRADLAILDFEQENDITLITTNADENDAKSFQALLLLYSSNYFSTSSNGGGKLKNTDGREDLIGTSPDAFKITSASFGEFVDDEDVELVADTSSALPSLMQQEKLAPTQELLTGRAARAPQIEGPTRGRPADRTALPGQATVALLELNKKMKGFKLDDRNSDSLVVSDLKILPAAGDEQAQDDETFTQLLKLSFILSLLVGFLITFSIFFTSYGLLEKEFYSKLKLHVLLSGITHMQYWFGVWIWDWLFALSSGVCWLVVVGLFVFGKTTRNAGAGGHHAAEDNTTGEGTSSGTNLLYYAFALTLLLHFAITAALFQVYFFSHCKNELWPRMLARWLKSAQNTKPSAVPCKNKNYGAALQNKNNDLALAGDVHRGGPGNYSFRPPRPPLALVLADDPGGLGSTNFIGTNSNGNSASSSVIRCSCPSVTFAILLVSNLLLSVLFASRELVSSRVVVQDFLDKVVVEELHEGHDDPRGGSDGDGTDHGSYSFYEGILAQHPLDEAEDPEAHQQLSPEVPLSQSSHLNKITHQLGEALSRASNLFFAGYTFEPHNSATGPTTTAFVDRSDASVGVFQADATSSSSSSSPEEEIKARIIDYVDRASQRPSLPMGIVFPGMAFLSAVGKVFLRKIVFEDFVWTGHKHNDNGDGNKRKTRGNKNEALSSTTQEQLSRNLLPEHVDPSVVPGSHFLPSLVFTNRFSRCELTASEESRPSNEIQNDDHGQETTSSGPPGAAATTRPWPLFSYFWYGADSTELSPTPRHVIQYRVPCAFRDPAELFASIYLKTGMAAVKMLKKGAAKLADDLTGRVVQGAKAATEMSKVVRSGGASGPSPSTSSVANMDASKSFLEKRAQIGARLFGDDTVGADEEDHATIKSDSGNIIPALDDRDEQAATPSSFLAESESRTSTPLKSGVDQPEQVQQQLLQNGRIGGQVGGNFLAKVLAAGQDKNSSVLMQEGASRGLTRGRGSSRIDAAELEAARNLHAAVVGDYFFRSLTIGTELIQLLLSFVLYTSLLIVTTLFTSVVVRDRQKSSSGTAAIAGTTATALMITADDENQSGTKYGMKNQQLQGTTYGQQNYAMNTTTVFQGIKARISQALSGRTFTCRNTSSSSSGGGVDRRRKMMKKRGMLAGPGISTRTNDRSSLASSHHACKARTMDNKDKTTLFPPAITTSVAGVVSKRSKQSNSTPRNEEDHDDDDFPEAADLSESDHGEYNAQLLDDEEEEDDFRMMKMNTALDHDINKASLQHKSLLLADTLRHDQIDSEFGLRKMGLLPAGQGDMMNKTAAHNYPARPPATAGGSVRRPSSYHGSTVSSFRILDSELQADAGVLREVARVRKMNDLVLKESQVLFLKNVTKQYPTMEKPAVSNLHFAVCGTTGDHLLSGRAPAGPGNKTSTQQNLFNTNINAKHLPFHLRRSPTLADGAGVFGLLGRNGAGKTTLFKLILQLENADYGEIFVLGHNNSIAASRNKSKNCCSPPPYEKIGYCPQFDESFLPQLTVFENLRFYGQLKLKENFSNLKVNNLIAKLHLQQYANKKAGHLSAGVQRKVCFAISLIANPQILLLDEPGVGIDLFSKQKMWDAVKDWATSPLAVENKNVENINKIGDKLCLVSTNNMEETNNLCSQVAIQVQGQWKCLGGLKEFESKYGGGYQVICDFRTPVVLPSDATCNDGAVAAPSSTKNTTPAALKNKTEGPAPGLLCEVEREQSTSAAVAINIPGDRGGVEADLQGGEGNTSETEDVFPTTNYAGMMGVVNKTNTTTFEFKRGQTTNLDEELLPYDVATSSNAGRTTSANMSLLGDNQHKSDEMMSNKGDSNVLKKNKNLFQNKSNNAAVLTTAKESTSKRKIRKLRALQQQLLLDIEEELGCEYEVMETKGTQVVLRFPTITEESPLQLVRALLEFFEKQERENVLEQFSFSKMQLKHVFNKFAGEVEI